MVQINKSQICNRFKEFVELNIRKRFQTFHSKYYEQIGNSKLSSLFTFTFIVVIYTIHSSIYIHSSEWMERRTEEIIISLLGIPFNSYQQHTIVEIITKFGRYYYIIIK